MPEKTDAGAAYLAALKNSTASQAAGAKPALASSATPSAGPRPGGASPGGTASKGADKRKNLRYKCQGSVRLRALNTNVATWATFTDISKDGCYLEAAESHAAGTQLALVIEVNGLRIETTGEVRVAYPGLGMGIAFTQMSDADRERLRVLLNSIPHRSISPGPQLSTQSLSSTPSDPLSSVTNPSAVLQAMLKFFENRHMMGREEFLRILRNSP
jgi:hypothetical protein